MTRERSAPSVACAHSQAHRCRHANLATYACCAADVQIGKGPVVVTHEARKTGHEKKKAHDWGPLGGW